MIDGPHDDRKQEEQPKFHRLLWPISGIFLATPFDLFRPANQEYSVIRQFAAITRRSAPRIAMKRMAGNRSMTEHSGDSPRFVFVGHRMVALPASINANFSLIEIESCTGDRHEDIFYDEKNF